MQTLPINISELTSTIDIEKFVEESIKEKYGSNFVRLLLLEYQFKLRNIQDIYKYCPYTESELMHCNGETHCKAALKNDEKGCMEIIREYTYIISLLNRELEGLNKDKLINDETLELIKNFSSLLNKLDHTVVDFKIDQFIHNAVEYYLQENYPKLYKKSIEEKENEETNGNN